MGEKLKFKTRHLLQELIGFLDAEIKGFLSAREPDTAFPALQRCRELDKGDFMMLCKGICARKKQDPVKYTEALAIDIQKYLDELPDQENRLLDRVQATAGYLNFFVKRPKVFAMTLKAVQELGTSYGHTDGMKGKKAVIEHTSSNPNAPLHIGNLRNVLLGGHIANLLKAAGYTSQQLFYVNDLGAQIGLTALAYSRIYDKIEPTLKIDQWIGVMYAVMNTFQELQKLGQDVVAIEDKVSNGATIEDLVAHSGVTPEDERREKLAEYFDIFFDLRGRFLDLFKVIVKEVATIPDILKQAGALNLRYEQNDPDAVKIFRKMVCDCLAGVQETLDTYGIRHDRWDFESELGWEGSNDRVIKAIKASPYLVPETQCNAEGKPQGGYLNMTEFIADAKLPTGKKGYQKEYPPLYVFRPDGSTLYTFRDVVYSFKKCAGADLVLNIICSEQNLAQEKVKLGLYMLGGPWKVQHHLSYELVKLTSGKMSGRRGRYLLADDLYAELKDVIREKMRLKYAEKQEEVDPAFFDRVTHEVSTAAMKYALLSVGCAHQMNFNMAKVTDFEDSSAPFLLYNSTRLNSLFDKFSAKVAAGAFEPLPPVEDVNYSLLTDPTEWQLLMDYVLYFPEMIITAACPTIPEPPGLPEFGTHRTCDFLIGFVREFSSYYKRVRVLGAGDDATMYARLHLLQSFRQVIDNGLRLLTIEPLDRM